MILAVGPGTPASCVISATAAEQSSSSSGEEDSDMFDDDSEDDGNNNAAESNNDDSEDEGDNNAAESNNSDDDIDDGSNEGAMSSNNDDLGDHSNHDDSDDMEVLPSDAEEGQYHFDDRRLVRDRNSSSDHTQQEDTSDVSNAREEAETEIARHLSAQITQSPVVDQQGDANSENEENEENDDQSTGRRRSHWERRQLSIFDALNGVGDETNNNNEGDGSNEDDSVDGDSSEGDRANANELLLDHLESLARRRERRMNAEGLLSSPARDRGVYNETTNMYVLI